MDAFRHCIASCMMTREYGGFVTDVLGEINEIGGDVYDNQARDERERDIFNNNCGKEFGKSAKSKKDCIESCEKAINNGKLKTKPSNGKNRFWERRLNWLKRMRRQFKPF